MSKHNSTSSSASLISTHIHPKASFRESTHLIPTPVKRPRRYIPYSLEIWSIALTTLLTLGLAVGLQVLLWLSQRNQGFAVPQENVLSFTSPSFLISFFPTLFVIPLVFQLRQMDFELRYHHPYVILSRGGATASESLLLDYTIGMGWTLYFSLKHRHAVIFFSTLAAVSTFVFQPLAGSVLALPSVSYSTPWTTTSTKQIGLKSDVINDLSAFAASAGYAEAAVYHHLPDPPFVMNGWATAEFTLPPASSSTNGTLFVNTTGIQTTNNCANPSLPPILTQNPNTNWEIQASSTKDGCSAKVSFDAKAADQQYGVMNVPCLSDKEEADVRFQGIMFWFFHRRLDTSEPESRVVFCRPTIQAFDVQVSVNLTMSNLTTVVTRGGNVPSNNVTGDPMNGRAFNAVLFPTSNDAFVQARSLATYSGISGAISRFANQGGQTTWDDPEGLLKATVQVYRQHLSLTAKSVYFVPDQKEVEANFVSLRIRLFIDPLSAHLLSLLLIIVGLTTLTVQIIHRRKRSRLYLTTPPGTMASVVALTSRSGFGEVLLPYDDRQTIKRKLANWRFGLEERTGAIVVESGLVSRSHSGLEREREGLLQGEGSGDADSSTRQARESALEWSRAKRSFEMGKL